MPTHDKSTRLSCVFYKGWYDYIRSCYTEFGEKYAIKLSFAIWDAIFGEDWKTDSETINTYIETSVLPLVEASQKRYQRAIENGSKGGRTKKISEEDWPQIALMRKNRNTQKQIAGHFGVSEDTIGRCPGWKDWRKILEASGAVEDSQQNLPQNPQQNLPQKPQIPPAPQNLYYNYNYDYNEYDNNNVDKDWNYSICKEEYEYRRSIYEKHPMLEQILSLYPNYLSWRSLGADGSYPDKKGWLDKNDPTWWSRNPTAQQRIMAAAAEGYWLPEEALADCPDWQTEITEYEKNKII